MGRMRGATNNDFFGTSPLMPREKTYDWAGVGEALSMALKMEKDVTARMMSMIDECSKVDSNDYYAADWVTGTWLEEQLTGQRHLAGLINPSTTSRGDTRSWQSGCLTRSCRRRRRR